LPRVSTEEIESDQKSQLKILNIKDNLTTIESFKSIWMLLEVNPEVVIYFDQVKHEHGIKSNKVAIEIPEEVSVIEKDFDQEALTEFDHSRVKLRFNYEESTQNADTKPVNKLKPEIGTLTRLAVALCCFKKKLEDGKPPSFKEVLGYHLAQSKLKALTFKPTVHKYL
jgi:hypothetical protein